LFLAFDYYCKACVGAVDEHDLLSERRKWKRELVKVYKRCGAAGEHPGSVYRPLFMKRAAFYRLKRRAQTFERKLYFKDERWRALPTRWFVTTKKELDYIARKRMGAGRATVSSVFRPS